MLFSTAAVALVALLPGLASASPVQKRATNQLIKSYRTGTCLTLQGGVQIIDGSALKVGDCNTATRWDISYGSGSVTVSGMNFALDAGVNPHNNVPAKVWTSYPGLSQQT
jgi:opacity protein-like surface antigen